MTKPVEIPPVLHFLPKLLQRQVPQLMWKTAEVPRSQFFDRFTPPVISQVTKHVEISLFKYMHRTSPFPRFKEEIHEVTFDEVAEVVKAVKKCPSGAHF